MSKGILFFADKLPPLVGGMELHADNFINYFTNHRKFPLLATFTKNNKGGDHLIFNDSSSPIHLNELPQVIKPAFIFFNSGRWIEEFLSIRQLYPNAKFIYRTGGNEIIKAPLLNKKIPNHRNRQAYWVKTLNKTINTLITNSSFTENRLINLGITCPFLKCIGGVNLEELTQPIKNKKSKGIKLFCAARFVDYKNHTLLIDLIDKLIKRGHMLELNLAGDGPLKKDIEQQVKFKGIGYHVNFLGALKNKSVCHEISHSDIYIQMSCDYLKKVEGGSYIHSEGMGRSILEAISAGIYVITGDSGALSEVVTSDRGLLLDLDNIEAMVEKIEQVVLQRYPRRSPYHGYDWPEVFKKYESLMENYIENTSCH